MKRVVGLVAIVLILVAGIAIAQQTSPKPESPGQMPMQGGMCPMMSGGMCPMMGGGTMPMMGMAGGQSDSPRMIQMRGEMMKAMGELMMKHGKMMEGSGR